MNYTAHSIDVLERQTKRVAGAARDEQRILTLCEDWRNMYGSLYAISQMKCCNPGDDGMCQGDCPSCAVRICYGPLFREAD